MVGVTLDTSQLKQAEIVLQRSHDTFYNLVQHAPLGIYLVDSQFRLAHVSEGAMPAFRNVHPLIGHDFADALRIIWPEPFASEAIERFRNTLATGESYLAPSLTHERKDLGTVESYEWQIHRVTLPDGQFGVVCYYYDSTTLRQAEESMRRSEAQFRMLADNMAQLAWICDLMGNVTWYNQRWLDYTGLSFEEMKGWNWSKVQHPDHLDRVVARVQRSAKTEEPWEDTFPLRGQDGQYRWFLSRAVPIRNAGGAIVCWFGTNTDITAQLDAEAARRRSEERFRSAFEHAATGIAILDAGGQVVQSNAALARTLGYTGDELQRLDLTALVHPEDRAANTAAIRRLIAGELPHSEVENRYLRKDGEPVWVQQVISLLREGTDQPAHLMILVTDLTARRQAQAILRHADRMETVGRLAGGVAHEANNQMTVVLGYAVMALARLDLPQDVAADLREIRRAAERTGAITGQLLAFSRQQILRVEAVDLNAVVEGFAPVLRRMLGESTELVFDRSPDLGPVQADRSQLEQILVNLAFNARDAMPQGGRLLVETEQATLAGSLSGDPLETLRPGGYGVLKVSDTGVGMSPEVLSRIFEPFFTTKPVGRGTGLGLSTVYGVVRQLGGDVQVQSHPGEGSSFSIYLPLADVPLASAQPPPPDRLSAGGESVLLVEDEPGVRAVAARALQSAGFQVLEAEHGEAALQILSRAPGAVKVVVSDVAMPVMNGRELAERLARTHPGLPVLLVSGYANEELARRGILAADSVPLLRKPFAPDALVQRVRGLINAKTLPG